MKKIITKTTLLCILSVLFAMSVKAQSVSGVAFSGKDSITLGVDSTAILTAIVSPHHAVDKSVVWMTTNKLIVDTVSVVEDTICNIKGIGVGEAKIIVMTREGNFRDTCVVKVVIPVDSVKLKEHHLTMILGHDTSLISTIFPSEPTNDDVIWSSSNPSVVDIIRVTDDSICTIKALRLGKATLFVTSVDGAKKDSCIVTVNALPIENFTLSSDSIKYMRLGSDTTLSARVAPLGETNDSVRWYSADHTIVEITSSGYDTVCAFTAKGIGATYIYGVSFVDRDKKDSCFVSVVGVPVTGVSLNTDRLELEIRTDTTLKAQIMPFDATNDSIRWTSSDSTTIDIVSAESAKNDTICTIRAKRSGGAYIYAQTFEGAYKDSCFVTVLIPVDSIVLNSTAVRMNLKEDTTYVLKAKIYPDSATQPFISPLEWVNKEEHLVKIDSVAQDTLCYIKALSAGVDTFYVETAGGVRSKWCYVTVDPRIVDSVRITKNNDPETQDTLFLAVNASVELRVTVYPSNATNDTLTLTSNDPAVLRIDSLEGGTYINALQEGTATLYAVATDGSGQKDSCIVKVRTVPATGIRLNVDTLYVYEEHVDSIIATILPLHATDKGITWRHSDVRGEILDIQPAKNDSVYKFKAIKADTALIFAYAGTVESGIKDSCVVIVKEPFVFLESDLVAVDGRIIMSLKIPEGVTFSGSFELQLPKGFGLTLEGGGYKTKLSDDYKEVSALTVTSRNDSTYLFEINPKTAPANSSRLRTASEEGIREALVIYYTIYDNALENSTDTYEVRFVDIDFLLSDETGIKEKQLKLEIKVFKDGTGNEPLEDGKQILVYAKAQRLYVNTAEAETVYVYSSDGSLILVKNKVEGPALFDLNTEAKILFVKGSSGWTQKVMNR